MEPDRPVTIDDIQLYIRAELNQSHAELEELFDDYKQRYRIENSSEQDFMIHRVVEIKVTKAIRDTLLKINKNLRDPKIYRDIAAEKYPKAGVVKDIEPREVHQGKWLFDKELDIKVEFPMTITKEIVRKMIKKEDSLSAAIMNSLYV